MKGGLWQHLLKAVLLLCWLPLLATAGGAAWGEALRPDDFAYGYLLETPPGGAIYRLGLPASVYREASRSDLADLRVFNGAAEPVAHGLRRGIRLEQDLVKQLKVPFFPLAGSGSAAEQGFSLDLRLGQQNQGTRLRVEADASTAVPGKGKGGRGYLLDLSEVSQKPAALEFHWQRGGSAGGPGVVAVELLQSRDLNRWTTLVGRASLVDLEYHGQRVVRRRIELPRFHQPYLKLILEQGTELVLERVMALSGADPGQSLHWTLAAAATRDRAQPVERFDYSSGGHFPVSAVRLLFPGNNTALRARISSRRDPDGPWHSRCQGLFYRLELEGGSLNGDPCSFGPSRDPFWRLEILDQGNGAPRDGAIGLELGWHPDELLFTAQGAPPYLLAVGSGKLSREAPRSELLSQLVAGKGWEEQELLTTATVGQRRELGGSAALSPPVPPLPWRQWILWGVLLSGLGLLAWMVRGLWRELSGRR